MGSHVESVPTLCWLTKMDGGRSSWKPEKYLGRSAHSSVHQWLIASYQADRTAESYLQQFRRQGHRPAQPPINTSSSHIFNLEFFVLSQHCECQGLPAQCRRLYPPRFQRWALCSTHAALFTSAVPLWRLLAFWKVRLSRVLLNWDTLHYNFQQLVTFKGEITQPWSALLL